MAPYHASELVAALARQSKHGTRVPFEYGKTGCDGKLETALRQWLLRQPSPVKGTRNKTTAEMAFILDSDLSHDIASKCIRVGLWVSVSVCRCVLQSHHQCIREQPLKSSHDNARPSQ